MPHEHSLAFYFYGNLQRVYVKARSAFGHKNFLKVTYIQATVEGLQREKNSVTKYLTP